MHLPGWFLDPCPARGVEFSDGYNVRRGMIEEDRRVHGERGSAKFLFPGRRRAAAVLNSRIVPQSAYATSTDVTRGVLSALAAPRAKRYCSQ